MLRRERRIGDEQQVWNVSMKLKELMVPAGLVNGFKGGVDVTEVGWS